jgi:hypothetical protein
MLLCRLRLLMLLCWLRLLMLLCWLRLLMLLWLVRSVLVISPLIVLGVGNGCGSEEQKQNRHDHDADSSHLAALLSSAFSTLNPLVSALPRLRIFFLCEIDAH